MAAGWLVPSVTSEVPNRAEHYFPRPALLYIPANQRTFPFLAACMVLGHHVTISRSLPCNLQVTLVAPSATIRKKCRPCAVLHRTKCERMPGTRRFTVLEEIETWIRGPTFTVDFLAERLPAFRKSRCPPPLPVSEVIPAMVPTLIGQSLPSFLTKRNIFLVNKMTEKTNPGVWLAENKGIPPFLCREVIVYKKSKNKKNVELSFFFPKGIFQPCRWAINCPVWRKIPFYSSECNALEDPRTIFCTVLPEARG